VSDNLPVQRFNHGCLSTVQSYDDKKRHPYPEYMEGAYKLAARSLFLFRNIILDETEKGESDSGHEDHGDPIRNIPREYILVSHQSKTSRSYAVISTILPCKATPKIYLFSVEKPLTVE
jgi:hypothetical protein